ncbi:5,10-methylenetetrahydromethanopterin reductase [Halocalculus aciditolerans]|uniref:5,10-methylenetetrahydromethanopterin reductase n=1 Tax=Halocalculus aciditolerans TaxID=1383812 RepID=A0A830FFA7_9EURY|nr:5,10-methylenetetrahydromethanopterin reductase [Halocalculus aciditolerans]GGL68923.1 5,10-methylenetetrahydromethanopterin reductase [Halocalculus aciditolerans]
MKGVELTPEVPVEEVAALAARAEAAGFDHVFASCHYNNRDPFAALTRAAAATESIRLGPGVANPYETHPVKLASQVATLDELSGGRAVFGVGAGDASTLQNLGVERERPLRRVLESFEVARDLWAGERVDHDGTFTARDAGLNYAVGDVPVFVGGQGPHMLRMAGKRADGVLVNASHPDDAAWAADRIAEGRAEREEPSEFTSAAFASVSVAEDGAAAREAARPPVAFIAAGAEPPVLDRHGIDRERASDIGDAIEAGAFTDAFDAVSDAMLDAFSIAGTPEEVEARIAALREHLDGVVAGSPLGPDRATAVDLLGDAF